MGAAPAGSRRVDFRSEKPGSEAYRAELELEVEFYPDGACNTLHSTNTQDSELEDVSFSQVLSLVETVGVSY